MTTREFLQSLDYPPCAYCRTERATQRDHVPARAMRRRYHILDDDARFHVPACRPCNETKFTFRLYPPGFPYVGLLPGKPELWREWDGGKLPEVRK